MLSKIFLLLHLISIGTAVTFQWGNKIVYNTAETDGTMAILLRDDEVQVCYADLAIPYIPSGRCNLGSIDLTTPNITFSGNDVWQTVNATGPFAMRFNDEESVIAYTNGNDSQTGTGKAFAARSSADYRRLSFYTQTEFDNSPNDQSTMVPLYGNFFALCYSMGYNDEVGGCRVGELRDDHTVYYGPHYTYYNGSSTNGLSMIPLSNSRFLLCYEQGGNSEQYYDLAWRKRGVSAANGTCQIAIVSVPARTIRYTSYFNFSPYGVDEISLAWLDQTTRNLLLCYNNYDPSGTKGSCVIANINDAANTVTFNNPTDYSLTPVDETNVIILPPGVAAANSSALVCYVDLNTAAQEGACTQGIVQTGNQISWSYKVSYFNTVTTDEVNLIYMGGRTILLCYVDTPGGSCKFGKMTP